jgi:small subunit ribosomal protein S8
MIAPDSFSDFIIRVKNANMIYASFVEVPSTKLIKCVVSILKDEGFIHDYQLGFDSSRRERIKIYLKYTPNRLKAINELKRISKSGLRVYTSSDKIPRVRRGMGLAVLSTSRGVMSDKQARKEKVGGEILCYVW